MAATLKISDGTTTVDFIADAAYRVSSWSPAVARRRMSELGGRGPYEDVVEEMAITIKSSTPLSKLETLQQLLDQAQQWARGEPVDAVLLHYEPESASDELQATILGAAGDAPMIELPPNYALSAFTQIIDPVVIRFRRMGLWLGASANVTSSTAANPATATMAGFTAAPIESPVTLEMVSLPGNIGNVDNSFFLFSSDTTSGNAAARIAVIEAELMANPADLTSVADTTNKARGGNVLRYTPSATGIYVSASINISASVRSTVRRWAIFINWRNNSATTSFWVRANLWCGIAADFHVTGPEIALPAGVSTPQWSYVGSVSIPTTLFGMELEFDADAASGTMDIDSVVLLAADSPSTDRALAILPDQALSLSGASNVVIEHQLLERLSPAVYVNEAGTGIPLEYRGDAVLFMKANATATAACWLATGGQTSSARWRATDVSDNVITLAFKTTRERGYLIPR